MQNNQKTYPVRFVTNGNKFGIEYLYSSSETEFYGFLKAKIRTVEKSEWYPIYIFSGNTINGFLRHRMVFDTLEAAQKWVIEQNKKEEIKVNNETWKVVE